jgi:3'-5' exoribonuclease
VTAAILHDIGKMEELCWNRSIKYTDTGHLLGHIMMGASAVEHAADKIADFHPTLKTMLVHMMLSHHGELEFGSPKRPKTLEAIVLHYADDIDAKLNTFQQAVSSIEDSSAWTERHWMFERPLFKGLPTPVPEPLPKPTAEEKPKPNGSEEEPDPFDFDLFSPTDN